MTKKEFFEKYWPAIKDKPVRVLHGYRSPWNTDGVITEATDHGLDVYITGSVGASTIRSIRKITVL